MPSYPPIPTAKNVAIMLITKLLSVLTAENNIYYLGQPIIAIDDTTGKMGIKIGDWDWINETPDAATPFNDLPWLIQPAAAGNPGFTPFNVRTTDESYAVVDENVVITDPRLVGVADPLINYTGQNTFLLDEAFEHDPVAGTITIPNIAPVDPSQHFAIFVPSVIQSEDLTALTTRVATLEALLAPVSGGLGIMIFRGTLAQAEALPGYTIIDELAGRALFGYKADDPNFGTLWNLTGNAGAVAVKLAANQIPQLAIELETVSGNEYKGGGASSAVQQVGQKLSDTAGDDTNTTTTITAGTAAADLQAIPTLPPHIEVFFLEWTGL